MVQTRWDGMRLCTNQRGRKKVGRTQVPDCRERFTQSFSHQFSHPRLSLTARPCLRAGGLAGWHMLAPVGAGGIGTLGGRSGRGSLRRYIFERFEMGQMGYLGAQILQSLYPGPRQALGP